MLKYFNPLGLFSLLPNIVKDVGDMNGNKVNIFPLTEPIITEGSPEFKVLEDAWTVVSLDNQRCLLSVPLVLNSMGREASINGPGPDGLLLLSPVPRTHS